MNSTTYQTFQLGGEHSVTILPARRDNFAYILANASEAVVIDTPDAAPIESWMREHRKTLKKIVNTHGHHDHVAGNSTLIDAYGCSVSAPKGIQAPGQSIGLREGDLVNLAGAMFHVLDTSGHTLHDISLYSAELGICFVGDTVFVGGCGRLFEGTANQLWQSICKIRALPESTKLFCGHDYAIDNLKFAAETFPELVEPAARLGLLMESGLRMPTTVELEKKTNVLWMADVPKIRSFLKIDQANPEEVFAQIRKLRNEF